MALWQGQIAWREAGTAFATSRCSTSQGRRGHSAIGRDLCRIYRQLPVRFCTRFSSTKDDDGSSSASSSCRLSGYRMHPRCTRRSLIYAETPARHKSTMLPHAFQLHQIPTPSPSCSALFALRHRGLDTAAAAAAGAPISFFSHSFFCRSQF